MLLAERTLALLMIRISLPDGKYPEIIFLCFERQLSFDSAGMISWSKQYWWRPYSGVLAG